MGNKQFTNILKPLSQKKLKKYDFIGFDVETIGVNNEFYMGGLYYYTKSGKPVFKYFFNKLKMIDFILTKKFQGKYIVATNLNFDLTVLFYNTPEWNELEILKQQSNIIFAKYKPYKNKKKGTIRFIDTFNYLKTSVHNLGKIINKPKLEKPECLGRIPNNKQEKEQLIRYNKRDCEVSCDFMYFLQKGINEAGGNLKITIASSSFDIWRRNFLNKTLVKEEKVLKDNSIKDFIFSGYYGGRTEVFKRGEFKNIYYYDINSLYPSVMKNCLYPLPQSVENIKNPDISNIHKHEGVSDVFVYCPNNIKPLLPHKTKDKLIFPSGIFRGSYNHNELRKALEIGYKILEIKKQIIYNVTFKPFDKFVEHFYNKRKELKSKGSEMEIVYKLVLNSLYGKFGQKKIETQEIINPNHFTDNEQFEELKNKLEYIDFDIDEKGRILFRKTEDYNGINVYPIIASYVTSNARILMYEYIKYSDIIYTDTDSCISEKPLFENVKELGFMKLEGFFKRGIFIKPKMYLLENEDFIDIKVKGLPKATKEDFLNILDGKFIKKIKFAKLNESFRRGLNVNQILEMTKKFSLEDDKRVWEGNTSKPYYLFETIF
jgi:hypothetical protein